MRPIVEAVPNFSEGRDSRFVDRVVAAFRSRGAQVLDSSMDPDHHRSVVTVIGAPAHVAEGALAAAAIALDAIDLRAHRGVHPRIGALDVLPLVPLEGISSRELVSMAHALAHRIAALGIPVFFYGAASHPPGRGLASLRRGGFEALAAGGTLQTADVEGEAGPSSGPHRVVHPTAGATCLGVRPVLLAWNVDIRGVPLETLREIAGPLRERDGGFPGLRTLPLSLPMQGRTQISMNLEDPVRTPPEVVFKAIESEVLRRGGEVVDTEVIGMLPDALSTPEAAAQIRLRDWSEDRVLSNRLAAYREAATRTRDE
ncbi:MAG: glutamate formimidoyltransferase [Gemmatimonadetes bacterium]|nr:glutamate formimidoyltransferase [Gemmatimonadota bacterium]